MPASEHPGQAAPDLEPLPPRFRVRIRKRRLVGMVPGTSSRIGVTPQRADRTSAGARWGYQGSFSGPGWDSMWLDMSKIVRPTRDGIHGREYIATTAEVGARPAILRFDRERPALT